MFLVINCDIVIKMSNTITDLANNTENHDIGDSNISETIEDCSLEKSIDVPTSYSNISETLVDCSVEQSIDIPTPYSNDIIVYSSFEKEIGVSNQYHNFCSSKRWLAFVWIFLQITYFVHCSSRETRRKRCRNHYLGLKE